MTSIYKPAEGDTVRLAPVSRLTYEVVDVTERRVVVRGPNGKRGIVAVDLPRAVYRVEVAS